MFRGRGSAQTTSSWVWMTTLPSSPGTSLTSCAVTSLASTTMMTRYILHSDWSALNNIDWSNTILWLVKTIFIGRILIFHWLIQLNIDLWLVVRVSCWSGWGWESGTISTLRSQFTWVWWWLSTKQQLIRIISELVRPDNSGSGENTSVTGGKY